MHDLAVGLKQLIKFLPILFHSELIVHVLLAVIPVPVEHFRTRFLLDQIVELKHQLLLDTRLQKLILSTYTQALGKGFRAELNKNHPQGLVVLKELEHLKQWLFIFVRAKKTHFVENLQVALVAEFLEPLEFLGVSAKVVLYEPKELLSTLHKWLVHE